jgi:hypothetical protein
MWSASPQAKVFAITHAAAVAVELVGEMSLYGLIPPTAASSLKTRFWSQYVIGVAISTLVGLVGYVATDCLAKSGWTKTAWVAALLPTLTLLSGGFLLHGVDTILGISTGTGSVGLIRAAFRTKKKSVTVNKTAKKTSQTENGGISKA